MSKEAYYFSHDANARHDPKILAMREDYGVKGYGVYWIIVEMLREQDEFKLPLKKYIWSAIAMQVQCKDYAKDDAKHFVEICINEYELFNSDGEFFWSNSLIKRMGKKNEVSEKRRAAAKARWDKPNDTNDLEKNDMQNDANAMQMDANAMQVDAIKGKEIKEKENKLNKEKDIILSAFDSFWEVYPRKLDKKKAFDKFKVAARNHDTKTIIDGASKYAKECQLKGTEKGFIKHPTTFLNAESFLNDFDTRYSPPGQARQGQVKKSLFAQGEESRKRQEEAEKEMEGQVIDWEKELEDMPF